MRALIAKFKQYPWFVIIGVSGLVIVLALTYMLTEFFHIWYLVSYIAATLVAWTVGFFLNSAITFRGHRKDKYFKRYLHFMGVYLVMGLLNFALVYVLTSIIGVYYLFSVILVVFPMSLMTFHVNKRHVFEHEG